MRDPKRIDTILSEIEKIWKENPDLRLGQLLMNTVKTSSSESLFYIEDEELLKRLKELYKNLDI